MICLCFKENVLEGNDMKMNIENMKIRRLKKRQIDTIKNDIKIDGKTGKNKDAGVQISIVVQSHSG